MIEEVEGKAEGEGCRLERVGRAAQPAATNVLARPLHRSAGAQKDAGKWENSGHSRTEAEELKKDVPGAGDWSSSECTCTKFLFEFGTSPY